MRSIGTAARENQLPCRDGLRKDLYNDPVCGGVLALQHGETVRVLPTYISVLTKPVVGQNVRTFPKGSFAKT